MNREEQGRKVKDVDIVDPDDSETQNMNMGLPGGPYHHIAMQGNSFNFDIATPAIGGLTFDQLVQYAVYLSLFSSDDDIHALVKKECVNSLKGDKEEKEV